MSRERLNRVIRIVLGLSIAVAFCLSVIAARPPYLYLGTYPAEIGQPAAIVSIWDIPAVYVTVSQPALVTFPPDWKFADQVCMAVSFARGPAPTALEFNDFMPQSEWDKRPSEVVLLNYDDIIARARDDSQLKIGNPIIAPSIAAHTGFRVSWFGEDTYMLAANQTAGGLLCYYFYRTEGNREIPTMPQIHQISFKAQNVHVMRRPVFYFRYNAAPEPNQPPQMRTLQAEPLDSYLARLAAEAPFAVKKAAPTPK